MTLKHSGKLLIRFSEDRAQLPAMVARLATPAAPFAGFALARLFADPAQLPTPHALASRPHRQRISPTGGSSRHRSAVPIGSAKRVLFDRGGTLFAFANDASWAYGNNSGAVRLSIA